MAVHWGGRGPGHSGRYPRSPLPAELVINGGFDTNAVWTVPAVADTEISGGLLNFNSVAAARTVFQDIPIVAGASYVVSFDVVDYVVSNVRVALGGAVGTLRSANGTFTQTIVAGSSNQRIAVVASSGADLNVDNVSVKRAL